MMILALMLACTAPGDTNELVDDTDQVEEEVPDEAVVRGLIEGEGEPYDVLQSVAWGEGWPLLTDADTWLFVAEDDVDLAGDFNDWTPEPMNAADGFWWLEVPVVAGVDIKYKLVAGSDWYADPWARSYEYDENGRIGFVVEPSDRFHLEQWPGLAGRGLAPRKVRVFVPAGDGPWPVLYMHDGQNLFDPESFSGGWRMQDAVAEVGKDVLIVGIDNTSDRLDEYGHTDESVGGIGDINGKGAEYAQLVHLDLRPHIEDAYRTNGTNGQMGSSMGGLISLYIGHLYASEYDFVGGLSSSLWYGAVGSDGPTMEALWVDAGVRDIVVYVDSGGDDGGDGCTDSDGDGYVEDDPNDSDGFCPTRQFADALSDVGYTWQDDLYHWYEPGAEHNEVYWAARVASPLGLFLGL